MSVLVIVALSLTVWCGALAFVVALLRVAAEADRRAEAPPGPIEAWRRAPVANGTLMRDHVRR